MAIDGSIIQFRDELNGNAKVYPLTYQNAVLGEDDQPLQTYITEYNVSQHHTNTDGTRVFTLNEAISTVPDDYKRGGLKLSFNSNNGSVETYVLDSSVWKSDVSYWKQFDVNKLSELSVEMMTLQYPDIVDVTHLFYQGGLSNGKLNGTFAPNINSSYRYCAIFRSKIGNVFKVTNLIGGVNTPAWIKYDKKGIRISAAGASVTINETLVMDHDGYIVFNHLGTSTSENFNVKTDAEILPINIAIGFENIRKYTENLKLDIGNNKESIESLNDAIQQTSLVNIDNIIDYDTIVGGIILDQNKGTTHESSSYSTTELIPVVHSATYEFSIGVRRLSQYDARGEYIDGTSIDNISTFTTTSEARYIKVSISTSLVNKLTCKIVKGDDNKYRIRDKYGNIYALDESISHWSNKKVIIFGDSSTDGNASVGTNWFARMCELLGVKHYKNFAVSGQTILNQEGTSNNYLKASIEQAIEYISTHWNGSVDVIMLQIGGNDMGHLSEIGSAEDAFSSYNYLTYKDNKTIYGSLRYCLELLRRTYPQAMITMGTVFGRSGSNYNGNAEAINDVIKTCCDAMKIQVIDGGKYMGFSPFTEISSPYYNDNNPNVVNDRTALSRTNPAYNFINDDTGEIVTYDVATNGGVLKSGYSKRYGLYTYDGKHQTKKGEDKVMMFMYNELKKLV